MRAQAEGSCSVVKRVPDDARMLRKICAWESRIGCSDMHALRCLGKKEHSQVFCGSNRSRILAASLTSACADRSDDFYSAGDHPPANNDDPLRPDRGCVFVLCEEADVEDFKPTTIPGELARLTEGRRGRRRSLRLL